MKEGRKVERYKSIGNLASWLVYHTDIWKKILQKDHTDKMVSEGTDNERWTLYKNATKNKSTLENCNYLPIYAESTLSTYMSK